MKDQVIMSKANGELAVAIPLHRSHVMDGVNYKKYAMHIDGCLYFFGSSIEYACDCGLDDVLNKYRKFKEGIK